MLTGFSQVRELQLATSQPLGYVTQYAVTSVASLVIAFIYCWNLTLVILATVPISALFLTWMSKSMQPNIEAQQIELSSASKGALNAFQNIEAVKCFNGQDAEVYKFTQAIRRAAAKYMQQAKNNATQIGFVRFMTLTLFVQGFWYGHHLVSTGSKSTGTVITTFWSCLTATQAIEQVLPHMLVLEKGRAAGAALRTVLVQNCVDRAKTRQETSPLVCEGEIEFRNVRNPSPGPPLR